MRTRTQLTLASPGVVLLALFFALPVLAVAVDALRGGGAAFARVFGTSGFWTALGGSAALTVLAATPAQAFRQVLLPQIAAPVIASFCLVAAVVFGAYGTALALVGTQLPILPLRLYSLISETGSDFPAAAALALLITAVCSTIITTGEWVGAKHERHL